MSWSNIILNPRRIGTPKRLAKEQPESFAKFIDPLNEDTFQDRIVNGVMTQHLGTVALLDLELAADLDPTEGARDGIETMVSLFSVDLAYFYQICLSLGYTNVYC